MLIPKPLLRQLKGRKLKKQNIRLAPLNLERAYEQQLKLLVDAITYEVKRGVIEKLPAWASVAYQNRPIIKTDAIDDDIVTALEAVKGQLDRRYTPGEIRQLARRTGRSVSEWNERIEKENLKRVMGVDVFFNQPYLEQTMSTFTVNNTLLIKSLKEDTINTIQKKVFTGFQNGTRWEEIAKDLEQYVDPKVGNVAKRARLIARDQVNKLNGQLTYLRQSELGVTSYVWRTMQDERVRDSHRAKDGKEYDWNNPPADTGHPGEDYNCRCYAEPVLSSLIESLDDEET